MNENKQPKHKLAVIGFLLSIIAIVFSFFCYSILTDSVDVNNSSAFVPFVIVLISSISAIISSVVAKKFKNNEIFSTLGMIIAFVAIIIVLGLMMTAG